MQVRALPAVGGITHEVVSSRKGGLWKVKIDWKAVDQKLKKILKKMEAERQNRENPPRLSESFR